MRKKAVNLRQECERLSRELIFVRENREADLKSYARELEGLRVDNKAAARGLDAAREEIETLLRARDLLADMVIRNLHAREQAEARAVRATAVVKDLSAAASAVGHPVLTVIGSALLDAEKRAITALAPKPETDFERGQKA